jgi:hypothetical protein
LGSRFSRQCEIFDISQPYRRSRPVTGIALLFFFFNRIRGIRMHTALRCSKHWLRCPVIVVPHRIFHDQCIYRSTIAWTFAIWILFNKISIKFLKACLSRNINLSSKEQTLCSISSHSAGCYVVARTKCKDCGRHEHKPLWLPKSSRYPTSTPALLESRNTRPALEFTEL